jgi:hypothetical protein
MQVEQFGGVPNWPLGQMFGGGLPLQFTPVPAAQFGSPLPL